jgi:hypothetical protein
MMRSSFVSEDEADRLKFVRKNIAGLRPTQQRGERGAIGEAIEAMR